MTLRRYIRSHGFASCSHHLPGPSCVFEYRAPPQPYYIVYHTLQLTSLLPHAQSLSPLSLTPSLSLRFNVLYSTVLWPKYQRLFRVMRGMSKSSVLANGSRDMSHKSRPGLITHGSLYGPSTYFNLNTRYCLRIEHGYVSLNSASGKRLTSRMAVLILIYTSSS